MMKLLPLLLLLTITTFAGTVEKKFQKAGLINIHTVDPSIKVDLVNSDASKNFFRENYYSGLDKAYLQKSVAKKLKEAQANLKKRYPGYSLCVLDAARPRSVSQNMYDTMKGTAYEKFVANPTGGSMHNYGVAVDIVIVNTKGEFLDMGFTPFHKTHAQIETAYKNSNGGQIVSKKQMKNRQLLATVMKEAGFLPLSYEWWHFIGMKKEKTRRTFQIIE